MAASPLCSKLLCAGMVLVLLLSGVGGATAAAAPQPTRIDSCTTITSPGQYVLTTDIRNSDATVCISIEADGVTFDGNGHTIDGTESLDGIVDWADKVPVGVGVERASNVVVKNVVTTNWERGVQFTRSTDGRVSGVTARENSQFGIGLTRTTNTVIEDSRTVENGVEVESKYSKELVAGIGIRYGDNNTVRNVESRRNTRHGVFIGYDSDGNVVDSVIAAANGGDGVTMRKSSDYNRIIDNRLVGNGQVSGDGDGVEITEFSSHNQVRNNVIRGSGSDGVSVNNGLMSNYDPDSNTGTNDNLIGNNRIVNNDHGLYLLNANDTRVVNNRIFSNRQYGIRTEGGEDNNIVLNTVSGSGNSGIELSETTGNLVWSNRVFVSGENGIVLSSARNNRLGNNSLVGNDRYGVALSGSDSNRLVMNWVQRNGAGGIEVTSSDHNALVNNDYRSNRGNGVDVLDSDDNRIARSTFVDNRDLSVFVHGDSSNNDVRNNGDGASGTHTLTVRGSGEWSRYGFVAAGDVTGTSRTEDGDTVGGSAVWGGIVGGTDAYTFTGAVANLWTTGDVTVLVDGERVAPWNYGPSDVTIRGNGEWSRYRLTTDGATLRGSSLESGDSVGDASLSGGIVGGVDEYRVAGGYTELVVDGDATVRVNGRRLHASA